MEKSTERYEAWLGERIPLIRADLELKHKEMRAAPFPFFRATFYRWSQTFPQVCANLMAAPQVLGVGDLHVENFGTWRDIEGRLIWGINDFDEACWLPYTIDLVRLAASAFLAVGSGHLRITHPRAVRAILQGYADCLKSGGRAFVLAEHHTALRLMAVERLKEPERYWEKLEALKTLRESPPQSAVKALRRMMPEKNLDCRIVHRIAGLGSLGRRRYVALAQWHGGSVAREAKELAISAWEWANPTRGKSTIHYEEIMERAWRCRDPFVHLKDRWIVRRLAPDCSRIELTSLPAKHDAMRLLHAMGAETANVHLGSRNAKLLLHDLSSRPKNWLDRAAAAMTDSVRQDWEDWKSVRPSAAVGRG